MRAPSTPSLLGRDDELRTLTEWTTAPRDGVTLVTIVGPPGVGKTSLARAFAGSTSGEVHFCELSACRGASDVRSVVVHALQPWLAPVRSVDALDAAIADILAEHPRLLLVLDNAETVTASLRPLLRRWLARAVTRVVVTSREPLDLAGEHCLVLAPLALPRASDATALRESAAGQLFLALAARHAPQLRADDLDPALVHRLVHALDGLPLAIELAAARLEVLSLHEVVDHLEQRFALLRRPPGEAPHADPRHSTLWSAIEASWLPLGDDEREVLGALSVLAAPFRLGAARAVAGEHAPSALELLVRRNLVQRLDDPPPAEPRYRLLESIREFALTHLAAEPARASATRERIVRFYLEHAAWHGAHLEDELHSAASRQWLELEHDNLLGLFEALGLDAPRDRGAAERALQLAVPLVQVVYLREANEQVERLVERAGALRSPHPDLDTWSWVELLDERRRLATRWGDLAQVQSLSESCLDEARRCGHGRIELRALLARAEHARTTCDLSDAIPTLEQAAALAERLGDPKSHAAVHCELGVACMMRGEDERCAEHLRQCLALLEQIPGASPGTAGHAHERLGGMASEHGDFVTAHHHFTCAAALYERMGWFKARAWARAGLGLVELQLGHPAEARAHYGHALETLRGERDVLGGAVVDGLLARLDLEQGFVAEGLAALERAVDGLESSPCERAYHLAFLGGACALAQQHERAAAVLAQAREAFAALPADFAPPTAVLAVTEGLLEVAAAHARPATAELTHARQLLSETRGLPSDEVRLFARVLAARLDELERRETTWWFDPDGRWLEPPGGPRVVLEHRDVLARLVAVLVRARVQTPGRALERATIAAAVWSDVESDSESSANRLYVSLSQLRQLGLEPLLEHTGEGYRLAPAAPVALGWPVNLHTSAPPPSIAALPRQR